MIFKTDRDRFFIWLWTGILLLINASTIVPMIFAPPHTTGLLSIFILNIIISGFILWIGIDIKYEFKEKYLIVKGGMFKSKILYQDITKVTNKPNIWVGYRIIFSKDAIAIHYKTALMGSVVISPKDKALFLAELKKRNENIKIDEEIKPI